MSSSWGSGLADGPAEVVTYPERTKPRPNGGVPLKDYRVTGPGGWCRRRWTHRFTHLIMHSDRASRRPMSSGKNIAVTPRRVAQGPLATPGFDDQSSHSRPGSRVLISWSSQPLPSGSLNDAHVK